MLLIKNGRVLDPAAKTDASLDILIDGEQIAEIAAPGKFKRDTKNAEIFDASEFDCRSRLHRHARAPARTRPGI